MSPSPCGLGIDAMPRCGKFHRSAYIRVSVTWALMAGRKETTARLENHERRLIRIETLIEISQARRRELPKA
jgi:hypothetical protein